jgi:hypothetical protein
LLEPLAPLSDWKTQREGTVEIAIDINDGAASWKKAKALWPFDLNRYLWTTRENLVFLFFGPSWPDDNRARLLDKINYQLRWTWAPLTLAVCIWTGFARRNRNIDMLLPALMLTWLVTQGLLPLAPTEGRYRKPLEGLLLAQLVVLIGTKRNAENNAGF